MPAEIVVFVILIINIAIGIQFWQKGNHLLKNGKKATAVVFKNNFRTETSGDKDLYYPVVRFLTDKQEWITQELNTGYSPAKKEGTKLEIIYDPNDPQSIQINSAFQLKILPRLLIIAGIVLLLFGFSELFDITQLLKD